MAPISELIENAEAVTSIFGGWPSFHDAEVHGVVLDRSGTDGPTLELRVHAFRMTDEIDSDGRYVLRDHSMVTLRFFGVALELLQHFNQQNALQALAIQPQDPDQHEGRRFVVDVQAAYGLDAKFECVRCLVVSALPYAVSA